jgi:hypothetical protein
MSSSSRAIAVSVLELFLTEAIAAFVQAEVFLE